MSTVFRCPNKLGVIQNGLLSVRDTLSREATLAKLVCLPYVKGSILKDLLAFSGVDPFFKGIWCTGKQIKK